MVGSGFDFGFVVGCSTYAAFVIGGCGGGGGLWCHCLFAAGHVSANSRLGAVVHVGLYGLRQLACLRTHVGCAACFLGRFGGGQSFVRWFGFGRIHRTQFGFAR